MTKFIIFGIQRTGTTFLMSLLNSHPDVFCTHELFIQHMFPEFDEEQHPQAISYNLYCKRNSKPDIFIPDNHPLDGIRKSSVLPDDFISNFCKIQGYKAIGFKLMLNQLSDNIIQSLKKHQFKFIIIKRMNYLDTYISEKASGHNKIMHQTTDTSSELELKQFRLEPFSVCQRLLTLEMSTKKLQEIANKFKFENISIEYENLVAQPQINIQKICDFLNVKFKDNLKSKYIKLLPKNKEETILNLDEIRYILNNQKTIFDYYKLIE